MSIWFSREPTLEQLNATGHDCMPGYIGIVFTQVGENSLTAKMPVTERTRRPFGRLHGGASVALAETVASVGGAVTVDREKFVVVGMKINANHTRPAKEGWDYAIASSESVGRTCQVWTIRIVNKDDKLVCLSRITLAVIPVERR